MKLAACPKCGCMMWALGEAEHLDSWAAAHAKLCAMPRVVVQASAKQAARRVRAKKAGKPPPGPPSASTPELETLVAEFVEHAAKKAGAKTGDILAEALLNLLKKS